MILKTLIFRPRFENKKLKKLEFTRVFHSILTRTQHLFTKFHKLATRTHSIFNLKTKTRHSYSLAVLLISTHSTLCKKLEIECGNSLTGFQVLFTLKRLLFRAKAAVPPAAKNRPRKNRPKNRHPPNLKSKPPILTTCFRVVLHRVPPVKNIVQQFLKKKPMDVHF